MVGFDMLEFRPRVWQLASVAVRLCDPPCSWTLVAPFPSQRECWNPGESEEAETWGARVESPTASVLASPHLQGESLWVPCSVLMLVFLEKNC